MSVCVCICFLVSVFMCTYACVYICVWMMACVRMFVYIYVGEVFVCMRLCVVASMCTSVSILMHTCVRSSVHMCVSMCVRLCLCCVCACRGRVCIPRVMKRHRVRREDTLATQARVSCYVLIPPLPTAALSAGPTGPAEAYRVARLALQQRGAGGIGVEMPSIFLPVSTASHNFKKAFFSKDFAQFFL